MSDHTWLHLRLTLPLVGATIGAIALHSKWPAGGFWINLATTLLGSLVAVHYVDALLGRHTQLRWRGATELIAKRLQCVCNSGVTDIRNSLGIRAAQLSTLSMEPRDASAYLHICKHEIEPLVVERVVGLEQAGWKRLGIALAHIYRDLQDVLVVFGARLRPDDFRAVLAAQDTVRGVLGMHAAFPDLLGVPDGELPPNRFGDQVQFKRTMTHQLADQVGLIVTTLRKLGESAVDFQKTG